jgi:hypothetical protein
VRVWCWLAGAVVASEGRGVARHVRCTVRNRNENFSSTTIDVFVQIGDASGQRVTDGLLCRGSPAMLMSLLISQSNPRHFHCTHVAPDTFGLAGHVWDK